MDLRRALRPARTRRSAGAVLLAAALVAVLVLWPALPSLAASASLPVKVPAPSAAGELTEEDVDAWLDGYLPAQLEAAGIVGAAVSVVDDGRVVTSRGYGFTSVQGGEPVDPDETLFRTGSVTKLVTATAAMQLVQDGRLDLDTDVSAYLDFELPLAFDEPITLRHLLTHTAGFEERVSPFFDTGEVTPLRDFVSVDPPEQLYPPGTTPAYSNYGMSLVGYLVERASGQPYDDYVQENILDPLQMEHSTVAQPPPADLAEAVSAGYADGGRTEVPFELVAAAPAGALSASATDMAHFMLAHLQGGRYGDAQLLDPSTTELMHTVALGEEQLGGLADGEVMALGFFREDRNGHRILGHSGDTGAMHSWLQTYPDDGAGIFVTLNSTGSPASVSLRLRQQLVEGFADRYFPDTRPAPEALPTSAEHARAAEGYYTVSRRPQSTFLRSVQLMQARVTAGPEGTLQISSRLATDGTPIVYREVEPWVFQEVGGQDRVAMRTDGDDVVTGISYEGAFVLLPASPTAGVAIPVLLGTLVVLVLTALAWPAAALTRRHYGRPVVRGALARRSHLAARAGALVVVVSFGAWTGLVYEILIDSVDPPRLLVRSLQALTLLGLVALVAGAAGHAWSSWRTSAWWGGRAWSVVLLLAAVGASWFAVTYGLLAPSASF